MLSLSLQHLLLWLVVLVLQMVLLLSKLVEGHLHIRTYGMMVFLILVRMILLTV